MVDHYENPRNVGSLDKNSKNVGTGLVGAPACGDVMKLQVRRSRANTATAPQHSQNRFLQNSVSNLIDTFQIQVDENGKIVDARFKTFGCGSAIASSSLATEWVKGKSVSWYNTRNKTKRRTVAPQNLFIYRGTDKLAVMLQIDEALKIKNTDIAKELCLPPVKLHCSSKFSAALHK